MSNLKESSIKRRSLSFSRSKSRTRPAVGEGPSFFDSVRHSTNSFLRSASKTRIENSATKKNSKMNDDPKKLREELFRERKKNLEIER